MSDPPREENRRCRLRGVSGIKCECGDMEETAGMIQCHDDHHYPAHQVNGRDTGFLYEEFGLITHVTKLGIC